MLPVVAAADIYRCTIDDRQTFRDKPCPDRPGSVPLKGTDPRDGMLGCFQMEESGRRTSLMRLSASGPGHVAMTLPGTPGGTSVPMRHATPAELQLSAQVFPFTPTDAVVMDYPGNTPNMPAVPPGLYKGKDRYLDTVFFFYAYIGNASAKPVNCP